MKYINVYIFCNLLLHSLCLGGHLYPYLFFNQFCSVEKGQAEPVEADSLKREFLDTNKCYILDCGLEMFVWMGRNTSLDERKSASGVADVHLISFCILSILLIVFNYASCSNYC
jgi:hypothetical protein